MKEDAEVKLRLYAMKCVVKLATPSEQNFPGGDAIEKAPGRPKWTRLVTKPMLYLIGVLITLMTDLFKR